MRYDKEQVARRLKGILDDAHDPETVSDWMMEVPSEQFPEAFLDYAEGLAPQPDEDDMMNALLATGALWIALGMAGGRVTAEPGPGPKLTVRFPDLKPMADQVVTLQVTSRKEI